MAKIRILPPETARLIAAGEVIERPASALRELLDNALDSGASSIEVELRGGGVDSLRVVDDGEGMDAEDLALSILPHATSKIASADDLLRARSLGFRGEALASIAAAAWLEITSRNAASREAHRLLAGPGREPSIEAVQGRKGTAVEASRLFADFPARRQFLKRAQAESALCRQTLLDKALPHPGVAFKLSGEGKVLLVLPPAERFEDRVAAAYPELPPALIHGLRFSGEGFEGRIAAAGPSFYRGDRRLMQIFVNRRRVQDFGLLSALDYAFEGFLPGGAHPAAFLFAEVDPSIADFNIHPAKREMRLKDPASLRRAIVQALGAFLRELAQRRPEELAPPPKGGIELGWGEGGAFGGGEVAGASGRAGGTGGRAWDSAPAGEPGRGALGPWREASPSAPPLSWEGLVELRERLTPLPEPAAARKDLRYLGTAFGLFLVVERGAELFIIDQHAAHERLLFDELSARPPAVQELLIPVVYEPESEAEDRRLAELSSALAGLGFGLEREPEGSWLLSSLPVLLREDPEGALRELLAGGRQDPERAARALAACRAAVKDGDELEPEAAAELAARALELPEPRCPHGRPVWHRLTREELFRLVRRIV